MAKYQVSNAQVSFYLSLIQQNIVAIPEIQRPFVWSKTQVRNLIDSLYNDYPIGYIITWQNPSVRLKDGTNSAGKQILIDGQQRLMAMRAALTGKPVINKKYQQERIAISFNPVTREFKVQDGSTRRGNQWLADISMVMSDDFNLYNFVHDYVAKNPECQPDMISNAISDLIMIKGRAIGNIMLSSELSIEAVNDIFIRINASGVSLSNADFAMSKIAVYEKHPGDEYGMRLRKFIDYFCNLVSDPTIYQQIVTNDQDFASTPYFKEISWLESGADDLFCPDYNDVLRVCSLTEFERGKLSDLVALLSGRDFETREYKQEIATKSFDTLAGGVSKFVHQYRFEHFKQDILRTAGFVDKNDLTAKNAINYAYAMYIRAHDIGDAGDTNSLIRRLFVLSLLTSRHSGSFETLFEHDIKLIKRPGDLERFVTTLESQTLTDIYWDSVLPDEFDKTNVGNQFWHLYTVAQIKLGLSSFLLKDNKVRDLTTANIHHLFPKNYLIKHGVDKKDYNKIADLVYLRDDVNFAISDHEPADYMAKVTEFNNHFKTDIVNNEQLQDNFSDNAIPQMFVSATIEDYHEFLRQRQKLMANLIRRYYQSL